MEEASGNKRGRYDEAEEGSPESKRIRVDLLFDSLDDESEPDNTDLDSVMRSLEEEIALPVAVSDPGAVFVSDPEPKQTDLGFLLEASDDELGLPPAVAADGEVSSGEVTGGKENVAADVEEVGFGKIWGLDDEIHLDFGLGSNGGGDDEGVIFDGGLFEYDGGICGSSDFSDLTWLPEFMPAV